MNRLGARHVAMLMVSVVAARGDAAPALSVSHLGLNEVGNRQWLVSITPDISYFSTTPQGYGGVVSTELAIEVTGADLASVTKNAIDWTYNTPGLNPFSGGVSTGVVVDLVNDRAFAALTSKFLTNGQSLVLLQVETVGSGATQFNWGGHELLAGTPQNYTGSRISQAGVNFDAYQGQLAVPAASGDFDGDGVVDGSDFLTWQRGLRSDGLAVRAGGDADSDGMVDGVDLTVWRSGVGVLEEVAASAARQLTVPEPDPIWLAAMGGAVCGLRGYFRRRAT